MRREEEIIIACRNFLSVYPNIDQAGLSIGFLDGAVWADKNPHSQYIAEYLYKEKGYPISLNGEIPTFEETMKNVQTYNDFKAKQWLEKACSWLREQKELIGVSFQEDFIERFKIAMKTNHENSSELVDKHFANVWHNVSEKPELNQYFLAQIGDNAFDTFIMFMDENKDWRKWSEGMNIKIWAHINDLLPKGGLNENIKQNS